MNIFIHTNNTITYDIFTQTNSTIKHEQLYLSLVPSSSAAYPELILSPALIHQSLWSRPLNTLFWGVHKIVKSEFSTPKIVFSFKIEINKTKDKNLFYELTVSNFWKMITKRRQKLTDIKGPKYLGCPILNTIYKKIYGE